MKQKETIRSLWTPTAGMLSGVRRAAMLLVMLFIAATATTATAQTITLETLTYESDGLTPSNEEGGTAVIRTGYYPEDTYTFPCSWDNIRNPTNVRAVAIPNPGFRFKEWQVSDESNVSLSGTDSQEMGITSISADVTLTAVFVRMSDDYGSCGEDVTWNFESSTTTLTVSGYGAMADFAENEQPWRDYKGDITTIVIEDGVTHIGKNAFNGVTANVYMLSLNPPTLGENAFDNSSSLYVHDNFYSSYDYWKDLTKTTIYAVYVIEPIIAYGTPTFRYEDTDYYTVDAQLTLAGGTNYVVIKDEEKSDVTASVLNGSVLTIPAYDITVGDIYTGDCGSQGNEVTWVYNSGARVLTISGTGAMADYDNENGQPWNVYKENIWEIFIEDGVKTIGKNAFNGCEQLGSITIPASVTSIGDNAFDGCVQLGSVSVLAPSCTLGVDAFKDCYEDLEIFVNRDKVDDYKGATNWSDYSEIIKSHPSWSSGDCTVSLAGDNTLIVEKTDPSSNTGAMADYDNDSDREWYPYTINITSIIIKDGVTHIGKNAFMSISNNNLTVTIPTSVTNIGDYAFKRSGLTSITIPASVTSIGKNAFSNCKNLMSVTIPASVTRIGSSAFAACNSLATVTFASESSQLKTIGNCAFEGCGNLTSVTIPNGVTSIGSGAFISSGLMSVSIPASMTSIGASAFCSCTSLASVTIHASSPAVCGKYAFDANKTGRKIGVPSSSVETYKSEWPDYANDIVGFYTVTLAGSLPDGVTGDATPNHGKMNETITLSFSGVPEGKVPEFSITYKFNGYDYDVYELKDNGDGTFSFPMPEGDVTVTCCSDFKNDIKAFRATVPNQITNGNLIFYKFESANTPSNGVIIGETVTNGTTTLVLGTDYKFGSVTYANGNPDPGTIGDECLVEVKGIGDYAGILYAPFTIISPSANGTYGDLSWSVADGTLSITGTGAMTAAATNGYPWYQYRSIITTISIGDGVTSIADNAFGSIQQNIYTYSNVAKVTIPASVTSIGADAFKGCITATDVYCYADPTNLTWGDTGDDFKSGDEKTKCHVADADAWSSFSSVNVAFEGDLAEKSIPYIDADGNMAYCTDFTEIDGNEGRYGDAGWYVVKGEVSKEDGGIDFLSEAHIILADDATLTLSNGTFEGYSHLTIYGQTKGNGTLNVTKTDGYGIMTNSSGNLTINGGIINATGGRDGLSVGGNLVINGGTVTGTTKNDDYSLYASGTITINGGQVTANGDIYSKGDLTIGGGQVTATGLITSDGDITLGWTNSSDQIKASQILTGQNSNTISIADGKAFTDGTNVYTSATPSADLKTALNRNVTLQPITGVTLTDDGEGKLTATLDPSSEEEVNIPVPVEVDHVNVDRIYVKDKASTIYLPFSIAYDKVLGGTFNKFKDVDETTTPMWTVKYEEVTSTVDEGMILANTPYIFLPDDTQGGKIVVNNGTDKLSVCTANQHTTTQGQWEFIGTHKRIKWTHDTSDPEYSDTREAEIGSVYGFAANDSGTDHVGDFVKVGNNVWINPERAYLKRTASSARAVKSGEQTQQLPDKMKVVIISASGTTTEIGTLDTRTGEISLDEWYSLDGQKLDGKPTKSGVYINNGKKMVVK